MEEVPPGHVAVGRVANAWGVRGALKVIPLVDRRQQLAPGRRLTLAGESRIIESVQWRKGLVHLKLSGINDRETALTMREQLLTVSESDLESLNEDEYYRFQLVGLAVETTDGAALGELTEVISTGANDVYLVRGQRGDILVPATDDVVKAIDLEGGRMVIEEMPGLLPEGGGKP